MPLQSGGYRRSLTVLGLLAVCLLVITAILLWNASPFRSVLRRFDDRVSVADIEQIAAGRSAHVRGIATYADPAFLCLEDDTAGFCFRQPVAGSPVNPGDIVDIRLRSATEPGAGPSATGVKVIGRSELPKPREILIGEFPHGNDAFRRARLSGIVRLASIRDGYLRMVLAATPHEGESLLDSPERSVPVEATILNHAGIDARSLVDSKIALVGVVAPGSVRREQLRQTSGLLLVASASDMAILNPAPREQVLVTSLRALFEGHSLVSAGHRVRVRGRVVHQNSERHSLILASVAGALPVETIADSPVKVGDYVEALGFPNVTEYKRLPTALPEISLQHASCRLLNADEARAQAAAEQSAIEAARLPILHTVRAIRQLTIDEARRYYPVDIEGVVTFTRPHPLFHYFFLQDSTGGIYVDSNDLGEHLAPGDRVRVVGMTSPGGFAPIVSQPDIRVLGKGSLPVPIRPDIQSVSAGSMDSSYVEMEGIVRPLKKGRNGQTNFELFTGIGRVTVAVGFQADDRLERLIDSRVRARGVLGTSFNQQRQLMGLVLFIGSLDHIQLVGPLSPSPSTLPVSSIKAVSQYSPRGDSNHRIRVRGVVTMVRTSKHLYLGDASGGLEVFADATSLQPGDLVEAVGYGGPGLYSPILQDATVVKLRAGDQLPAPLITVEQALSGEYDNQLIQIEATLLNRVVSSNEQTLMMRSRDYTFTAHMTGAKDTGGLGDVREGSIVRLTGICSVQVDPAELEFNNSRIPQGFRVLFRSPADLSVIREAPWWNLRRTLFLLGVMTAAVLLALIWVIVLGRKVHSRTAELRASKRAAEEAREVAELAHNQSKALIENAPYGIATLDHQGALLEANPAFRKIADIDRDAPIAGIPVHDLLRLTPESDQRFRDALKNGPGFQHLEVTCMHHHPAPVMLRISGLVIPDHSGSNGLVEIITEDITSQRQLEQQLLQSQRIEAVGRLAGGIAHDFNNLLMIISSYTSMLAEQFDPYSQEGRKLHAVEEAAQRATGLTHQLLAYSRKQMLEPKVLSIDSLVSNLKDMLRRLIREDIDIRFDLFSREARVKVDPTQFEQVLINLAVNARDAMPGGGALTIRTEFVGPANGNMPPGDYIHIAVSDTGVGMDKATQERIFEPFFTTKELGKGTGLGLSMVYGIVKQSGGFIYVESRPGAGSTFRIYLPVVALAPTPAVDTPREFTPLRGMGTILVVEDQSDVRTLISATLRQHGYKTLEAGNGEEGLAVVEENLNRIDMVVSDVIMPKMSGTEFKDRIRAIKPDMLVLFISGYTDQEVGDEFLDASTQFLQKPFSPRTLVAKTQEMLASRRTAQTDLPYQLPLQ